MRSLYGAPEISEFIVRKQTMLRYPLNMPPVLKEEAEYYAVEQGISLNQFILWAVSEKVGALKQRVEDSTPPLIAHRRGVYGPTPVVRGTGIRCADACAGCPQFGTFTSRGSL